ncbi:hypothetical protein PR202_ga14547 [Eleusine coracana subsp. coracana]|uniref:TFIIS N-terminal domain-containing protein n=1 Tax=Eleusine coracana subsp. coracana TaxID=191504 RepID=A0AAV5CHN0_ELECO|nr:hypothetical protein PR202_ga14547 [Eleusine coracana subsp. coracana]
MASESQSPFRRWKRFFRTFDTIDAAIVASQREQEVGCAEELRQAKGDVVQLLCDAPDDAPAEDLCQILDQLMVEYLVTLKTVPVTPSALACTDIAKAVGFLLEEHESDHIRGLARDIVHMWRSSVERDLTEAKARLEELRKLSDEILVIKASTTTKTAIRSSNFVEMKAPKSTVPAKVSPQVPRSRGREKRKRKIVVIDAPEMAATKQQQPRKVVEQRQRPATMSAPSLKKSVPVAGVGRASTATVDKMEATQRKLRAGYQEAEDAKCQRKIVVPLPATMSAPSPKTSAPVVGIGRASTATVDKMPAMDKMMEATKRKLQAGYQEAADAKRQRKIVVIEAPKMAEQKRRIQARCGATTAARRSLMSSSLCRV